MPTTKSSSPALLTPAKLRQIAHSEGPCITIFLPPWRPGEPAGAPSTVLKAFVGEAEQKFAKSIPQDLLESLRHLSEDPAMSAGTSRGRAILMSKALFEEVELAGALPASMNVGSVFAIRKLAADMARHDPFYVLAITKSRVALKRCVADHAEAIDLPPGIPATLAEAMDFDRPDHDLENRSTVGSSLGSMRRIRFGTGSDRETQHAHLVDYYKLVDRGLTEYFGENRPPLILTGIEDELGRYHSAAHYAHLISEGIVGSHGEDNSSVMLQKARAILRKHEAAQAAKALAEAKERVTENRFSMDLEGILSAAFQGRVGRLYLDESAATVDQYRNGRFATMGKEDLLNVAAVQTIAHGGSVHELPADMMPEKSTAVALFRY